MVPKRSTFQERNEKVFCYLILLETHQLFVTVMIGVTTIYTLPAIIKQEIPKTLYTVLDFIPAVLLVALLLLNYNKRFAQWRERFSKQFDFITKKLNVLIFGLSLLRYVIFSHQFYFLLIVFDVEISYWLALQAIAGMYLISSMIPMLSLFDFVVKGSVAVTIFSLLGVSPLIILTITTLMWILNFVLPAILGSYYVLTFKPVAT